MASPAVMTSLSLCCQSVVNAVEGQYTEDGKDLAVVLSTVASIQDPVSGLAFSLLLFFEYSTNFNMELCMETNLFTVFNAVKSECASLWGIKRRAERTRDT
jgi:hypothetical protein